MKSNELPIYTPAQAAALREHVSHRYKSEIFTNRVPQMIGGEVLECRYGDPDRPSLFESYFYTCGMGAREMEAPAGAARRIEFLMLGNAFENIDHDIAVIREELSRLMRCPLARGEWYGAGHTLAASNLFTEAFGYPYLLLRGADMLIPPAELPELGAVHFLQALPIHAEELEWIESHSDGAARFLSEYFFYFDGWDDIGDVNYSRGVLIPRDWDIVQAVHHEMTK